jgi:hypothetical protein
MNEEELLTIRGETDEKSTSGVIPLDSDLFYSTVDFLRIPKGMTAKIWFKKIAGEGETLFTLQYTYDCTVPTPTWKNIQQEKLASKGELAPIEKRRPEILRAFTGKEAIRVIWTQPTAAKAYVELGLELE